MHLEENSIKDPIDFASNLSLANTEHILSEAAFRMEQKQTNYENRIAFRTKALAEGKTFDWNPDECEECGDEMPELRKKNFEYLCTACQTQKEVAERRRGG